VTVDSDDRTRIRETLTVETEEAIFVSLESVATTGVWAVRRDVAGS
jgi:hypothetical protein